jgi:small redox-active disulfide protein 2
MKVQVLGAGCKKCNLLYQNLKSFIEKNNLEAEIEYIDYLEKLLEAKVLMPPAVFIDGVKKSEGKTPSEAQFKEWFQLQ